MQAKALSLAAELFRKIEPKQVKPQQAADWNGPFPLPASLAEFYAVVGPAGSPPHKCCLFYKPDPARQHLWWELHRERELRFVYKFRPSDKRTLLLGNLAAHN